MMRTSRLGYCLFAYLRERLFSLPRIEQRKLYALLKRILDTHRLAKKTRKTKEIYIFLKIMN